MTWIILPRSNTDKGIAYHVSGNPLGIPLLFIHGVGLRAESWYQQIDALGKDYRIYAMDMPGHGHSRLLDVPCPRLSDFTDSIAEFIATVIAQPAVIIGHSMGALLALHLAKAYPQWCLGIVPMNAVHRRSAEARHAVQQRAASLRDGGQTDPSAPVARWFSDQPGSSLDQYHAQLCTEWLQLADRKGYATAYSVFAEEDGLPAKDLRALTLPCLFITGKMDPNSTAAMTRTMAKTVPNAQSQVIPDSRHMTPLTHATVVNQTLSAFLQRINRLNNGA